ncbi:MAG: class I SAM-dependent methyltransferase [Candidatus Aenigmarchaeota archaeon]|nr:class I SAM-dependent methyltransferase [Candidatus Aenigmarchaeota archaeon]
MNLRYLLRPEEQRRDLIAKNIKNGVVLDLGSQEGDLHNFLKENVKNSEIMGINIVKNKNVDVLNNLNFGICIADNSVDSIVAGEVIEHLLNPFGFLQECYRILKDKGRLIITTPNMTSLTYILKIQSIRRKLSIYERQDPHLYGFSMEMLELLLEKAGFKILNKKYLVVGWRKNILFRVICYLFKNIRPTLFIVAMKDDSYG